MDVLPYIYNSRIVVIIDNEQARETMLGMLHKIGCENFSVLESSLINREWCLENQMDLVILGLCNAEASGFGVLELLVQSDSLLPVLVLSREEDRACRLKALGMGAADYLEDTVDLVEFTARIRNLLEVRYLKRQLNEQLANMSLLVDNQSSRDKIESASRKTAEERLLYLALHDERTGLPNRIMMQNRIAEKIVREPHGKYAVIMINLEYFHEINQSLGYQNGNKLLAMVANRLSSIAPSCGGIITIETLSKKIYCFSILEGVNFALMLDLADGQLDPQRITEKIISSMQQPYSFQGMSIDIAVRGGIALYPEHGVVAQQLLQSAQTGLESAQSNGQIAAVFKNEMDLHSSRRIMLMGELRKAIMSNELELYYQPQVDILTDSVIGVEALLRWNHPELGYIPPDEFIPLAEQTGVIKELTRWVLKKAIYQASGFMAKGINIRMGINISARNLHEEDICEYVFDLIERCNIPPDMIVLEITESAMMIDAQRSQSVLQRLREKGINFSIDDFGTGYSSLLYLKQLPITEVKVDRSFVMDMCKDKEDLMIVHATIEMGHNLELSVVAEGVEDQNTWDQLRDLGCDVIQGYFLGRPMPRDDFEKWLEDGDWSTDALTAT